MKVDILLFDDWSAMYIDGHCVYQNSQINGVSALQALKTYQQRAKGCDLNIVSLNVLTPNADLEKQVQNDGCAPDVLPEELCENLYKRSL